MAPFAQLLCAVAGSAILYMGLRAIRVGYFSTIQGRLRRERFPRMFRAMAAFWLGAAVFLFAAAVGVFAAVSKSAVDAKDRQIDPTARVGAITPTSTEADLIKIYGAPNVQRQRPSDTGVETTVLFADTQDELVIEWKNNTRAPAHIIVRGGAWMTTSGVAIGVTLSALEAINEGPFDLTGANWDRPIRVVSWKGGVLPPLLQVDMTPSGIDTPLSKQLRSQKMFFESSDEVFKKVDLVVKRLILEW